MTELLKTLYRYALEMQTPISTEDIAHYKQSEEVSQCSYEKLFALLSDEGKQHMQNYIREIEALHDIDLESMFLAGLSIGLELSRL